MLSFKNTKLKYQIFLLIFVAILVVSLLQGFYYYQFYNAIKHRSDEYSQNMMRKIETEIAKEGNVMQKLAASISYNKLTQEYLSMDESYRDIDLMKNLKELLSFSRTNNDGIEDIILYDIKNKATYTNFKNTSFYISFLNELAYKYKFNQKIPEKISEAQAIYTSILRDKYGQYSYYAYIYPIFSTKVNSAELFQYMGVCIVLSRLDTVKMAIDNAGMTPNSIFLLIDGEGNIVSNDHTRVFDERYREISSQWGLMDAVRLRSSVEGIFSKDEYIINQRMLSRNDWNIFCVIPVKDMVSDLQMIRTSGLLLELLMILILFILGFVLNRNISRPIFKMVRLMELIGKGESKTRILIPEKNEIGTMSSYINQMLDKIDESNERIMNTQKSLYQAELIKKKTQLSALQSQINPHFLYNTLDCIKSIALARDVREIVEITSSMVVIFRYAIREDELVTVEDELDSVRRYLNIMNIRYRDKFFLEVDIDPGLHGFKTLKMILQPVVENSIYHGLEPKRGRGCIMIRAGIQEKDIVYFKVIDNGKGIPPDELSSLRKRLGSAPDLLKASGDSRRSIGLANINSRIKIQFGEQYGIDVDSRENEETCVVIRLPVL